MRTEQPIDHTALPDIAGVCFEVHKMTGTEVLWIHDDYAAEHMPRMPDRALAHQRFDRQFGFGIAESNCFARLSFDRAVGHRAVGERYGGRGIGDNGGGVRAANFAGVQVKGIGQNPLVGATASFLHSYGALTAAEAVYEAVYTCLLNTMMPVGAVRIHGIILTAPQAAYWRYLDDEPEAASAHFQCWGALMVREICQRPAHFLRAAGYAPRHAGAGLPNDVARVRANNRALFHRCGGATGFVEMLATFLRNCAWQFAFGSAHSLAHGTLTPSNLALDGRWLDLSRCTFFPTTQDNGAFLSSDSEWRYPLVIMTEWAQTFAKYNRLELDLRPLTQYYERQFHQARQHCILALCGIEVPDTEDQPLAAMRSAVAALAVRIIEAPKTRTLSMPVQADPVDPMTSWLTWLMCPGIRIAPAAWHRLRAVLSISQLRQARRYYHRITRASYLATAGGTPSYRHFLIEHVITTMRGVYLREFFYKKRLDDVIFDTLRHSSAADSTALVDNIVTLIGWAYGTGDGAVDWLYRGNGLDISRNRHTGSFAVVGNSRRTYANAAQLARALDDIPDTSTLQANFQFKPYLHHLLLLISLIEGNRLALRKAVPSC